LLASLDILIFSPGFGKNLGKFCKSLKQSFLDKQLDTNIINSSENYNQIFSINLFPRIFADRGGKNFSLPPLFPPPSPNPFQILFNSHLPNFYRRKFQSLKFAFLSNFSPSLSKQKPFSFPFLLLFLYSLNN